MMPILPFVEFGLLRHFYLFVPLRSLQPLLLSSEGQSPSFKAPFCCSSSAYSLLSHNSITPPPPPKMALEEIAVVHLSLRA